MKIIYIVFSDFQLSGANKKILCQFKKMIELTGPALLIVVTSFSPRHIWFQYLDQLEIPREYLDFLIVPKIDTPFKIVNKVCQRKEQFLLLKTKVLANALNNTIIYMRYPGSDLFFYDFLKKLSHLHTITEHQDKEISRYSISTRFLPTISDIFFGSMTRKLLSGIVGVTPEILKHEIGRTNKNIPGHVMTNGIDCSSYKLRKYVPSEPDNVRILFIGTGKKYHGLDRLFYGLKNYKGPCKITITIIGDSPEMENMRNLAKTLEISQYLKFCGFIEENIDVFFNTHDIAVGSLALHRIGLEEGSVLKVREYCARGIPFCYGYNDPDIPENFTWALKFQNNDHPIDFKRIISFAKMIKIKGSHCNEMRYFAQANLDWDIKIRKLLVFFANF